MSPSLSPQVRPWAFYALAVGLCTTIALGLPVGTAVLMQTPLIATLVMLLVVTREGWSPAGWSSLGLGRLGLRWWVPALAVPAAVFAVGHSWLWLGDGHALGRTATAPEGGLLVILLLFLSTVVTSALLTALPEEIGWRGYLLPRLRHLGDRRALVLSGFLHGAWHLPVILWTDLYHSDGNRWLVSTLFLLVATCGGVFMGYLRLRSGSVWPAVIAHAAHNVATFFFASFTLGESSALELVAGERGLVTVGLYLAVAAVILTRLVGARAPDAGSASVDAAVRADAPELATQRS